MKRYWAEIKENTLRFGRKFQMISILKDLTLKEVMEFYVEFMRDKPRKISIQIYSSDYEDIPEEIPDKNEYYGDMKLHLVKDFEIFKNLDRFVAVSKGLG